MLSLPASLRCLDMALEILAASSGIARADELEGRVGGEGGAPAWGGRSDDSER